MIFLSLVRTDSHLLLPPQPPPHVSFSAELADHIEPSLGPRVSAARAAFSVASFDNRRILAALRKACPSLFVRIDECAVHRLIPPGESYSVETDTGVDSLHTFLWLLELGLLLFCPIFPFVFSKIKC